MGLYLSTAPASEPVALSDAKVALGVADSDRDTLITNLLAAARELVEIHTGRALIQQTWVLTLDGWPRKCIWLPRPPLQSVTHVKYLDSDGTLQTWSSGEYTVSSYSCPAFIELGYNKAWPTARTVAEAIQVTYVAGYANAAAVPEAINNAIVLMAGEWLNHPYAAEGMSFSEIPHGIKYLLRPYTLGKRAALAGLQQ